MAEKKKRNLHMMLEPILPERKRWRCCYCGAEDTWEKIHASECTHVYPPCEYCEGSPDTNECAPDCKGILDILASPDVYVAGEGEPTN